MVRLQPYWPYQLLRLWLSVPMRSHTSTQGLNNIYTLHLGWLKQQTEWLVLLQKRCMVILYVVLTRLWSPQLHGTCKKDEVVQTTTGSGQKAEAFSYCPLIHSGFRTSSVVFDITEYHWTITAQEILAPSLQDTNGKETNLGLELFANISTSVSTVSHVIHSR